MALGSYNEMLLRGASTSLQQIKAWLAGDVGATSLPAKPRIDDLDRLYIDNEDTTAGNALQIASTITTSNAVSITTASLTTGKAVTVVANAVTTGKALDITSTSTVQTSAQLGNFSATVSGSSLSARSGTILNAASSRTETRTTGTTADDYDVFTVARTQVMNGTGGTLTSAGAALKVTNTVTQTAGTLTDTSKAIESVSDGTGDDLYLENTNAGATGAKMELYHNSASPAASDVLARLTVAGKDGGGTKTTFGRFDWVLKDATDTSEDALAEIHVMKAGTLTKQLTVGMSTITPANTLTGFSTVTTLSTAGDVTYSAAQIVGGLILRDPNGAARTDTTATAVLLVAAVDNPVVGTMFEVTVRNTADAAETITVAGGVGVTISGTATIAQSNSKRFLVRLDNVTGGSEAVTLYSLGTVVH